MLKKTIEQQVAHELVSFYNPLDWGKELRKRISIYNDFDAKEARFLAKRGWLKKICDDFDFPLNPKVREGIISKSYFLEENHAYYQIVWATFLVTTEISVDSDRYFCIKNKLISKYGQWWWVDLERKYKVISLVLRDKPKLSSSLYSLKFASNHGSITAKNWIQECERDFMMMLPCE